MAGVLRTAGPVICRSWHFLVLVSFVYVYSINVPKKANNNNNLRLLDWIGFFSSKINFFGFLTLNFD
jgi:hypothetical protein